MNRKAVYDNLKLSWQIIGDKDSGWVYVKNPSYFTEP